MTWECRLQNIVRETKSWDNCDLDIKSSYSMRNMESDEDISAQISSLELELNV